MEQFLALGLLISFSGTVTFPSATDTHACARQVPADRFLVETDCPFLAPVPRRGKRNEPANVVAVAERLASLRGNPWPRWPPRAPRMRYACLAFPACPSANVYDVLLVWQRESSFVDVGSLEPSSIEV